MGKSEPVDNEPKLEPKVELEATIRNSPDKQSQNTDQIGNVHQNYKPFKCNYCEDSFRRKDYLKKHVDGIHEKSKPSKCSDCEGSFSRKEDLKRHVNRVHLKIKALKKASCTKCKASFEQKSHLDNHM